MARLILLALLSLLLPLSARAQDVAPILAGNPVTVPLRWAGLYETTVGKYVGHCTAQFITQRIILLAAHCVRDQDTGEYYDSENKDTTFLLQFQNDSFSKLYRPICRYTYDAWVVPLQPGEDPAKMSDERWRAYKQAKDNAWQFDYALVYLNADSITGHYNIHVNETWDSGTSTGYPHNLMGGLVIQRIRGDIFPEFNVQHSAGLVPNEQIFWHGNRDYTQGASGGAWVANFSSEVGPNTNIIMGLNSFDMAGKPGASFGPIFNDNFTTLLKFVQDRCSRL